MTLSNQKMISILLVLILRAHQFLLTNDALLNHADLTARGVPLNVIVMKTQLKMGEDVVTLTEHSLEFLVVRMHLILYNAFL